MSQTFTSSIHYSDWGRQVSSESSSPPLSASPVASPTDDRSPTHANVLEDREIGVWKCGQCQERFTQRSALRLHVCPSQANKPFQCGHCSLSFADPTKLRAHVVTHNNERPFKCGFCSRTFAGATTLNNHVRTHTGQKPFTCEKCGKSFSQASQMSRHQRLAEDCQWIKRGNKHIRTLAKLKSANINLIILHNFWITYISHDILIRNQCNEHVDST